MSSTIVVFGAEKQTADKRAIRMGIAANFYIIGLLVEYLKTVT